MRRGAGFVPMISLALVLTACGGQGGEGSARERAGAIQSQYQDMESFSVQVELTADYGQRIYTFGLTAEGDGEETVLTLTQPELLAGVTARTDGEDNVLEYDGLILETGPLDEEGLSPLSAIPVMLAAAGEGYITECLWAEEDVLQVRLGDPERVSGQGREILLWFASDTGALIQGEIWSDGARVIQCAYTDFTKE